MKTELDVDEATPHDGEAAADPRTIGEVLERPNVDDAEEENNVFRVLGEQARTRSRAQLWVAAIGGSVDAGLLWWRHPMLGWLAAGCAAVAAYGIWGLLDRAMETRVTDAGAAHGRRLASVRDLTAIVGTLAALWAVLSFMAVALGNWNH